MHVDRTKQSRKPISCALDRCNSNMEQTACLASLRSCSVPVLRACDERQMVLGEASMDSIRDKMAHLNERGAVDVAMLVLLKVR